MSVYLDTSFLCSVYRNQRYSRQADAFIEKHHGPLPVSSLLLLEFRQSLRLQVRLYSKDRTRGFSRREAAQMFRDLQSDLRGGILEIVPVEWSEVHQIAEWLSDRHTEEQGHRLVDILHVATAVHLGASEFLTFDENQKRLAEAEGITVAV